MYLDGQYFADDDFPTEYNDQDRIFRDWFDYKNKDLLIGISINLHLSFGLIWNYSKYKLSKQSKQL